MYLVQHLYEQHGKYLGLDLLAGKKGLARRIRKAEVNRPGLSLAGYLKGLISKRIVVIGKQEIEYLKELDPKVRKERLEIILTASTPAVIAARGIRPLKEMVDLCEKGHIPLFRANATATTLQSRRRFDSRGIFGWKKRSRPRSIGEGASIDFRRCGSRQKKGRVVSCRLWS